MAETEQNDTHENDDADFDDELASLSADEKAAFEKIMAEINAASGPSDNSEDKSLKSPPQTPESQDAGTDAPPAPSARAAASTTTDDAQNAPVKDEVPSAKAPDDPVQAAEGSDDDALTEEQQSALDQIMAEIESKKSPASNETSDLPEENEDDQESEDLSEDQQAALDAIMAEISAKRKGDTPEPVTPPDDVEPDSEDLSDDQQAALDAIMAEISAKRKGDAPKSNNPSDEKAPDSEDLSEDQQAALDAIMAEISDKKKGAEEEDDRASQATQENTDDNGLTIEEFDTQLSELLTEVPAGEKAPEEPGQGQADTEQPTAPAEKATRDYPILQEIEPAPQEKKKAATAPAMFWRRRKVTMIALALVACLAIGSAVWVYRDRIASILAAAPLTAPVETEPSKKPETPVEKEPEAALDTATVSEAKSNQSAPVAMETPSHSNSDLGIPALKRELAAARQQIQEKISDISHLKSYYNRGITEEKEKIVQALEHGRIPAFAEAVANKKIELALRAIQRRKTYIAKLGTPFAQLTAMSEELLFLERKTETLEILMAGINGLPIASFAQEAAAALQSYLQYNTQLSIDQVEVDAVDLSLIWSEIGSEISKKADLLAQRAPLNRAIGKEICQGNYERKYQLTAISVETAKCLVRWPGKDLYLNALNELTPEVAEILAQWPGEWISLNGITELPSESARHLAAWPGKRLSLNGLTRLSPEATAHLSRWRGEQLELVGLLAIGSWENYGTRLFLSEKLRRQLEAQ